MFLLLQSPLTVLPIVEDSKNDVNPCRYKIIASRKAVRKFWKLRANSTEQLLWEIMGTDERELPARRTHILLNTPLPLLLTGRIHPVSSPPSLCLGNTQPLKFFCF